MLNPNRAALLAVLMACSGCGGSLADPAADAGDETVDALADSGAEDVASVSDAKNDGDAAACIPQLGACNGTLLCCSGATCEYGACGVDPACAGPGQTCDGWGIHCCDGAPCTAGKCPGTPPTCAEVGKSCGAEGSLECCASLLCSGYGSCYDPTPCSLSGDACGKACCPGLSCDSSGTCSGSLQCAPGGAACFDCLAANCCGELTQCKSVYPCGDQLACLAGCVEGDVAFGNCQTYCKSSGALIGALGACAATQCAFACG